MKKYFQFMKEITPSELYEGLLAYGLFSEKLPPFLTSENFYHYCKAENPKFVKKEQTYIYYESMRNINIPRALGIPNPMLYQRLCEHISSIWSTIVDHFEVNTKDEDHKISRIHVRKTKDSSEIFKMNYKNFKNDGSPESNLVIGKKHVVNADISTCFPSIYTHSFGWALVGKEVAKDNKGRHNKWYNELDFFVRNLRDGETHGILIGPHASNLLAEIILTKVDYNLNKSGWKYIRNIDDYTCYVESTEKGQKFLVELSEQLRYYGLVLNHKKTIISPLPVASSKQWVRQLNAHPILTKKETINYKEVQSFLDLSIQVMQENNLDSAILNYAIKVLAKKTLTKNAADYLVKTVFHLSFIYPYLIPLLEIHVFDVFSVDSKSIRDFSNLVYEEGLKNQNYESVSYSIYFAIKFDFLIDNIDYESIKNSNHCILLLLLFLYCQKNANPKEEKELKRLARNLNKNDDDFNRNWLFVYEVLPKSDLKSDWKKLKEKGVTFVKL